MQARIWLPKGCCSGAWRGRDTPCNAAAVACRLSRVRLPWHTGQGVACGWQLRHACCFNLLCITPQPATQILRARTGHAPLHREAGQQGTPCRGAGFLFPSLVGSLKQCSPSPSSALQRAVDELHPHSHNRLAAAAGAHARPHTAGGGGAGHAVSAAVPQVAASPPCLLPRRAALLLHASLQAAARCCLCVLVLVLLAGTQAGQPSAALRCDGLDPVLASHPPSCLQAALQQQTVFRWRAPSGSRR